MSRVLESSAKSQQEMEENDNCFNQFQLYISVKEHLTKGYVFATEGKIFIDLMCYAMRQEAHEAQYVHDTQCRLPPCVYKLTTVNRNNALETICFKKLVPFYNIALNTISTYMLSLS